MSKIYEALEQAQKEQKRILPGGSSPAGAPAVAGREDEMIGLYHSIETLLPGYERKSIQFIGSREGEGTSTIVRELALVAASKKSRTVLLVDEDRKNPKQHTYFGTTAEYSWENTIREGIPIEQAVYRTFSPNLFVTLVSRNAGFEAHSINPSMLTDLWERLTEAFDYILVDSPPMPSSPDSLVLSRMVDGIILVIEAEKTRWPVVECVKEKIVNCRGNILGVVLNKRKYHIPDYIYRKF
ncbi:MAG: CpsD/CapB family tyrosine-protein kinase [Syntrophales bacterium]